MTRSNTNVLINQVTREQGVTMDILWVVGFSLLTALMAQIQVRVPFMPVPVTGQTFAVLLSGAVLGSRRGFACQMLYLAEGAAGLPVFAGGGFSLAYLLGPTGGYLLSFPVAAGLVGLLVERGASRNALRLAGALFAASLLILFSGTAWLSMVMGLSFQKAASLGLLPFLAGDVVKIALVGLSLPKVLKRFESRA
jgi:biotin transport system substrate-specific component